MLQSEPDWKTSPTAVEELMTQMKPCLNQDTLKSTVTESFIPIAKKTGFGAVELAQDKVEPLIARNSLKALADQIKANELTVASIMGPENFNLLNKDQFSEI